MAVDWEFLKEKRAGLPVWTWAALVGVVGITAFYIMRGRSAMNKVSGSGTGTVATDPYAAFTAAAMQTTTAASGTGIDTGTVETNTSWLSKVVNYLLNKGIDPLTAQNAAQTYLDGGVPLTPAQAGLVSQGITQFGLPPDGVFGIPSVLTPDPTPVDTTPVVTSPGTPMGFVRRSDGEIAQLYSDNSISPLTPAALQRLSHGSGWTQIPDSTYNAYTRRATITS